MILNWGGAGNVTYLGAGGEIIAFDTGPANALIADFLLRRRGVAPADSAATLSAFTVEATAAALRQVPAPPRRWLVGGGGRRNPLLMRRLGERLGVRVEPLEAI